MRMRCLVSGAVESLCVWLVLEMFRGYFIIIRSPERESALLQSFHMISFLRHNAMIRRPMIPVVAAACQLVRGFVRLMAFPPCTYFLLPAVSICQLPLHGSSLTLYSA